ncbi:MAG: VIT domain-containing protein, partial [Myxococcota bacterium]
MSRRIVVTSAVLMLAGYAQDARAQDDRRAGLFTEARQLPLVSQFMTLHVRAGEAHLDVVQCFRNDGARLAQADFRMPLPEGATVDGFGYWRGGRYLASTLKAREEAELRHAGAATEGRVSGLAKTMGSFASLSVVPVEAGAT